MSAPLHLSDGVELATTGGMALEHSKDLYPPVTIPKRHLPWFTQMLLAFAALVLAGVVYSFWTMGRQPARTLDVPVPPAEPASERAAPANR